MNTKPETGKESPIPLIQRVIAVLWPSFLTAGAATGGFFTAFDPHDLTQLLGYPDVTRTGAYTIGFFLFWFLTAFSCMLTCYFQKPCNRIKS